MHIEERAREDEENRANGAALRQLVATGRVCSLTYSAPIEGLDGLPGLWHVAVGGAVASGVTLPVAVAAALGTE